MLKSLRYAALLACLLGVGLAAALLSPPAPPRPREPDVGRAGAEPGAGRGAYARRRPVHRAGRAGPERDTSARRGGRPGRRRREPPRPRRPDGDVGRATPALRRHLHRRMEERLDGRRPPRPRLLPLLGRGADLWRAGRSAGRTAAPVSRRALRPVGAAARRYRDGGRPRLRPTPDAARAARQARRRSAPPARRVVCGLAPAGRRCSPPRCSWPPPARSCSSRRRRRTRPPCSPPWAGPLRRWSPRRRGDTSGRGASG